jgi:DNA-binding transcriptional LysR family regulator
MDVYQLELFLAVLDCGSVTRAAERMHLTPGAVSLQIHGLAAELRAELFARAGKHLAPTPAAERLAEHARGVLRQMRQIRQEFENDPDADTHPFHFATGATTLIHRLGRPLRLLRRRYPKAPVQVTVAATEEMVAGLHDRRFDLALISLPCNEQHLQFKDLGVNPSVAMEADDTDASKRLVESGFGCGILPEIALRKAPRYFQVFRIANRKVVRRQALAMVQTEYPRALTLSIASFLQTALAPERSLAAVS